MFYNNFHGIDHVPYFSQRLYAENYKAEGFPDMDTALSWSRRLCGLACLKMVIAYHSPKNEPTLFCLLQEGLAIGAYKDGVGWVHNGLIQLANQYGLKGGREAIGGEIQKIATYINNGNLIIASVAPAFEAGRTYTDKDGQLKTVGKGGHLIVITHALYQDSSLVGFRVHHPSSEQDYEWSHKDIGLDDFNKSFSSQGNIIYLGLEFLE